MPFTRPDLLTLANRIRGDLFSRLAADDPLRRSDAEAYARVMAGSTHELYGYLDWLARQLMPDTAEAEYLERWANIWGITRKPAAAAVGSVTFTGLAGSVVPAGAVLAALDGIQYATVDETDFGIATTKTAAVSAVIAAAAGNRPSGQTLTLISPVAGVNSGAVASAMSGGADIEGDAGLLSRLLFRIRNPPMGGAERDYITWAGEVPGVTRVWVSPHQPGPGQVTVRFMRDDDLADGQEKHQPHTCKSDCEYPLYDDTWRAEYWKVPNAAELEAVFNHIEPLRPVTATLFVKAPVIQTVDIVLSGNVNSATKQIVEAAIAAVFRYDVTPGKALYAQNIEEAVEEGGMAIHVVYPTADIPAKSPAHLHFLGNITWLST